MLVIHTEVDRESVRMYSASMTPSQPSQSQTEFVQALQEQVRRIENAHHRGGATISSGSPALDRHLPDHGFQGGSLVEWVALGEGAGAGTLAMLAAREACRSGGSLVVIDRRHTFYPPAAASLGVELQRLILVYPQNAKDHEWALDQTLRCAGAAAVVSWVETIVEPRTFRRLQLAAEMGGSLGLLVRPYTACKEPSWADLRLQVQPLAGAASARRVRVELLRCRGAGRGTAVELELCDETGKIDEAHPLPLAPPLAGPAVAPGSAPTSISGARPA